METKVIDVKFCSCRPYSRLYVGVNFGDKTITNHFDKQFDGAWYNVVADILYNERKKSDNDFRYIDEYPEGVIITKEDTLKDIIKKVKSQFKILEP